MLSKQALVIIAVMSSIGLLWAVLFYKYYEEYKIKESITSFIQEIAQFDTPTP